MNKKPNILFIMADSNASIAISSYEGGSNSTPNIDRLAEEGVQFENY